MNLRRIFSFFKKEKDDFFTRYEKRVEELSKIWGVDAKANVKF